MNIHTLQEKRAAKIVDLRAAKDDATKFDALETEIRAIDKDIKRAATLAEMERQSEAAPDQRFDAETREFNVSKAIRESVDGKLTGREAEVSAELGKGREVRGVMIPTALIFGETRAQTVGSPTAGGNTVATNLGGLIDRLRPVLAVQGLGATIISGLTGNLDLPKLTAGPTAYWVAEDGTSTESSATFGKVSLSPKTVTGQMYLSRRLILQNSVSMESVLRNDLAYVLAQALDKAAIKGGGSNEPDGILETIAENGTSSTALSDIAADLIAALELDDVTGTGGFLTHPSVLATARKIKEITGSNLNVPISATFHGEKVVGSNNVPDDGNSPSAYPIIYGNWSNLVVGYFSGVDILADPYGAANKGGLNLFAFLDADIAVRHAEAFAWKA